MDERRLKAADVSLPLQVSEQTIHQWRTYGVPERRRPHVERFMAGWVDPALAAKSEGEMNALRIEFTDAEIDEVSKAARIVDTPIREFIRRSAVHQARNPKELIQPQMEQVRLKVAEQMENESPPSIPADVAAKVKYPKGRRGVG